MLTLNERKQARKRQASEIKKRAVNPAVSPPPVPAAFDSEHDENLTLTSDTEKKFKIINYRRFAITRDIQGKRH